MHTQYKFDALTLLVGGGKGIQSINVHYLQLAVAI